MKPIDMAGRTFGRLTVVRMAHSNNGLYWQCLCECGNRSIVKGVSLRNGSARSCGCGSLEAAVRNQAAAALQSRTAYWPHTRTFKDLRRNMIRRCSDPSDKRYSNYGGRGIAVCNEWTCSPKAFYEWLIANNWQPGLSIERKDVDGHYEPSNCCLIPVAEQQNNTTRSHHVEWNGERHTIAEWARIMGVRNMALQHRFDRGWSVERAMSQPFRDWPKCN